MGGSNFQVYSEEEIDTAITEGDADKFAMSGTWAGVPSEILPSTYPAPGAATVSVDMNGSTAGYYLVANAEPFVYTREVTPREVVDPIEVEVLSPGTPTVIPQVVAESGAHPFEGASGADNRTNVFDMAITGTTVLSTTAEGWAVTPGNQLYRTAVVGASATEALQSVTMSYPPQLIQVTPTYDGLTFSELGPTVAVTMSPANSVRMALTGTSSYEVHRSVGEWEVTASGSGTPLGIGLMSSQFYVFVDIGGRMYVDVHGSETVTRSLPFSEPLSVRTYSSDEFVLLAIGGASRGYLAAFRPLDGRSENMSARTFASTGATSNIVKTDGYYVLATASHVIRVHERFEGYGTPPMEVTSAAFGQVPQLASDGARVWASRGTSILELNDAATAWTEVVGFAQDVDAVAYVGDSTFVAALGDVYGEVTLAGELVPYPWSPEEADFSVVMEQGPNMAMAAIGEWVGSYGGDGTATAVAIYSTEPPVVDPDDPNATVAASSPGTPGNGVTDYERYMAIVGPILVVMFACAIAVLYVYM